MITMITVRKIIYWHFAVYKGDAATNIDPDNLPSDAISSLDTTQLVSNPIIVNANPRIRAFSFTTGYEWLVDIYVSDGVTKDFNAEGKRTTIRANNPTASGGFAWFDLNIAQLTALFGTPIVVDNLAQLEPDATADGGRARQKVQYVIFGVYRDGETSPTARTEPDDWFAFNTIPSEVSATGDPSHLELMTAMTPKTFVDAAGGESGFFIEVKSHEEVDKLGCCDILSSSSSSSSSDGGSSSSSSDSEAGSTPCPTDPSFNTVRGYPRPDSRKRIWAVRQTVDIHASNYPVSSGSYFSTGNILTRRKLFSELIYVDVEDAVAENSFEWNKLAWNHAGYISFRDQQPELAHSHILPEFNKTSVSVGSGAITAHAPYDYNYELPITIQALTWDDRGYLWALCSGGATDSTPDNSSTVGNVKTTEGIYRLIPGGWQSKAVDFMCWGGTNTGKLEESDFFNGGFIASIVPGSMSWGLDRSGNYEFLAAIDTQSNLRIWQEKNQGTKFFPDDSTIVDDSGKIITAQYIDSGIDKICVIDLDKKPYLISQDADKDEDLLALVSDERLTDERYSLMISGREFVIGITASGRLKVFANANFEDVMPTQVMADDLADKISADGDRIKEITCGDAFFAVLTESLDPDATNSGKVHARGFMNGKIIYNNGAYTADVVKTLIFETNDAAVSITAFGDFLIGIEKGQSISGEDNTPVFPGYFRFATVLHSYRLNDAATAIKAPEWSSLNKIKRILISAKSGDLTKPEFWTQPVLFTIKLPKSKGLIGAESSTVKESSEYIYSPYYGQSNDLIQNFKAYPGLFGHAVATSPAVENYAQGDYVVISAPGEGGTFGDTWIDNGPGAVYIFKRTAHELTFIQKITNITANAKNHGAHLAMFKTKDANDNAVLGLACSYRDTSNNTHKLRIYHLDSSGNYFNVFSPDGIPAAPNETASSFCDILSMYANDGILVIAKNVGVKKQIFTCIDTNNNLDDISNAPGAHIEIDYSSLLVNVGTRAGVSVLREPSGFTMVVSDIEMDGTDEQGVFGGNGLDDSHIKINYNGKTQNGHGGFFVFHMRVDTGDGISFTSGSNGAPAYFKQTENFDSPINGTKSNFGYSIVSDESNICVSAVYDSTYGYLEAGSVFTYEWSLGSDSPLRSINPSTKKKITLKDLDDWSTGNSHLNDKAYAKLKFGASMLLKNGNLIIGAWENDDFTLGCAVINEQKPGSLSLWRKNNIGVWGIVATSQSGSLGSSKGDRFGCSLAVIDVSGGGFVLLSGASGLIAGANETETVTNTEGDDVSAGGAATKGINPSVAGIVKTILISGSGAFGSLPSRTPKRYENSTYDNTGPYNFTFLNNAFGKRHVSVGITQSPTAHTTVYSPARLIERSVIETDLDVSAIPKFKLAKFAKDPMTGLPMPSTYSDLGAFSMESDLKNGVNQTANDITVAALPLYDSQSYTIRVLEMHPRPYRTIDVSSPTNSSEALDDAKLEVPFQISEGVLDWATLAISNGSEIYLYAPIVRPLPPPLHSGNISESKSFAISPLRADRWLVPVSEISSDNFNLYDFGLAINANFASFRYDFAGGYYTANTIALTPTVSTHTSLIGNPIIKAKDIEPATEKWWTAGNYYSPGCVQLIQSGRVGGIALKKGSLTATGTPPIANLRLPYISGRFDSSTYVINSGQRVKVHDIWGLKIAEGSWSAVFLEDFPKIKSVSATSQFLGWSACSLDVGSTYEFNNVSGNAIGTSFDTKYEKCAPSADTVDFDLGHQFSLPAVHISATKWCTEFDSATDVTNNAPGFGKNIMYQGVKDPVIHGRHNYNKFNATTPSTSLSSIAADRRSMIITFHSGFGATVRPFKNDDSSFAYFAPQLKFTALLDRRLSSWKNFWNTRLLPSPVPITANYITASTDPSWVSQKSTGNPNVDDTLSYSSRVAPTDTLYITDIFQDSSERPDVPSPADIRNIIYNYCFPNGTFDFYKVLASQLTDARFRPGTYISVVEVGTTAQVLPIIYSLKYPDETYSTATFGNSVSAFNRSFHRKATVFETNQNGRGVIGVVAASTSTGTQRLGAINYLGQINPPVSPFYPAVSDPAFNITPGDVNIFDYPNAVNMLYGRGRNVQISPFGLECRSTGRDEIIFQNEFIYRKLKYHNSSTNNSSTNYPHGVPRFTDRRAVGTFDDLTNIAPVKIYTDINDDFETAIQDDNIIIRQRADTAAPYSFTLSNPSYVVPVNPTAYEHYEIYDRVAPADLFDENSLVCMPTFSLPDMFNITTSTNTAFGHVFGVGNGFTITPSTIPYQNASQVSSLIYYGINSTNVPGSARPFVGLNANVLNNSAFVKAVQNKLAHVIDVNSSVVSIDNSPAATNQYMLTVSILASFNADKNPTTAPISDSWQWENTFDPSIYGGGLICAIMTAMLDKDKKIINGSWRSTFSTNVLINGVNRDANLTASTNLKFLCANQWNRNGIWLQPLIGLARSSSDNYNSPWYWPGNYPWSNSNNASSLGPKPKDIVTSRPNFFHAPPGMIKVPMDRSFIHKMGKHSIVKYSDSSGSKWFAVIGPVVYQVNSANDLKEGPWAWIKKSSMSCVPMSEYIWDSRPVIFQRFGFTKAELNNIASFSGNVNALFAFAECASDPTEKRLVKSHYSSNAFGRDLIAIPAGATQINNELINFDAFNEGNQGSYAMLGEGVGFSKQDGNVLRSFVWWKDVFYHITPGPTAPSISKINLPSSIATQVNSAYSLHRLSGYFNGNDRFVISGNASNNEPFMHVFKFKSNGVQTVDGFAGVGFALEYSFPVVQPAPANELFTASEFDPMCNQSWRYATWMSSDASIIAVGNHQWDDGTSSGNPSAFNVQIYLKTSINNQLKYVLLSNNTLTVDDAISDRPVESFCQSIWGVQEGGFWSIYVCSGADPNAEDREYLDPENISPEKRFGRVHVFKAQATSGGGKNVIELNDMAIATDPDFKDSAFANMNFWTMTPVSAKNGMCGIMFSPSTGMVVSTAGSLAKMSKGSADNKWKLDKFAGQASGALGTTKTIAVSRVIAPYNYFGYANPNTNESITYAETLKDIFKLSTVAVPSCNSTAFDSGMQRYASKLSFVRLNVDGADFDSIISISNSNSTTSNQFGVFDTETDLSSGQCNPAYYYLQGKRSDVSSGAEKQIFNPSFRAWLCSFDILDSSFGTVKELPYQSYNSNKENDAHIIVKPPAPDAENRQMYFAGLECAPVDGNPLYRDYNDNLEDVKGTLMQMDWHDIAGVLWWGGNNIYVLRSHNHQNNSIADGNTIDEIQAHVNAKSYSVNENGAVLVGQNAVSVFKMPTTSTVVTRPTKVTTERIGIKGIGLSGPMAITVAACSNPSHVKDNPKAEFTYITPLMRRRDIFGPQRVGIVVDDSDAMNESYLNNGAISSFKKVSIISDSYASPSTSTTTSIPTMTGKRGEQAMCDFSWKLAFKKDGYAYNDFVLNGQPGVSIPDMVHSNGDGAQIFSRKYKLSSSHTKWNKIIEDISASLDHKVGNVYNGDKIFVMRKSFVYKNFGPNSAHLDPSWYYVPSATGHDIFTHKVGLLPCNCKDALYAASRYISKWKTNASATGNILDMLVKNSGQNECRLISSVDVSASESNKLKDLVLIGMITDTIINDAARAVNANTPSVGGLLDHIYNNIYDGNTSLMAQGGMVHIIDTNKEKNSDLKLGFIRLFQSKFNGTYTTIKGY